MNIARIGHEIRSIADRSKLYSQRHFRLIGGIAVVSLPLYSFIEEVIGNPSFNTLYLRILAGCAALPILFHDRLPPRFQDHLAWVWIGAVAFTLPFTFGTILTLNAALADEGHHLSPIWAYQYLVALFIFLQLINNGFLSALLWLAASFLVVLVLLTVTHPNITALKEAWLYPLPVYLTALIVGSITNRNVHVVQAEQLRAASAIGTNIAHELRTPLASIRLIARATDRLLPILVDGYGKAAEMGAALERIRPAQLNRLSSGLHRIQAEVDYSNTVIDMLLANTSESPTPLESYEALKMSEVIEEAIARFPFNNSYERGLLSCRIEADFQILAPRALVVHVIFNLVKNALYFVQKTRDGRLWLVVRTNGSKGIVDVTDTGVGIPPSLLPRIFDRFYSSDPASQGAGIGLSYCKMVMEALKGEIACDSAEGAYTNFRLVFPSATPTHPPGQATPNPRQPQSV